MAQIDLKGVDKYYGNMCALESTSMTIGEGEFFSLLGPSGSGKTTLLRLVAGFLKPNSGTIRIGDRVINDVPPHRRNIGMVFQQYALFPHRTAAENVAFGLEMRKTPKAEIEARVAEALSMVQLSGKGGSYPRQLSGGQQQRVAIARSIALRPSLLLLDEPLSALDRKLRGDMQIELRALQKKLGITALYVTHDQDEALSMSDRIGIMNGGRIIQQGTARDLYDRPETAFVANFLGSANVVDIRLHKSADQWRASIADTKVPVNVKPTFQDGQQAKLALRPERLRVVKPGSDLGGQAGISGTIATTAYLGGDLKVVVATNSGEQITARMSLVKSAERTTFDEGEKVVVAWDPEEAICVAS